MPVTPTEAFQVRLGMTDLNKVLIATVPGSQPSIKFGHVTFDPFTIIITIDYIRDLDTATTLGFFLACPRKMGDPIPVVPQGYKYVLTVVGTQRPIQVFVK